MTIVPELPCLFLERQQIPVKCLLKWNNLNSAVLAVFNNHTIKWIQGGQKFPQEPAECIVGE